MSNSMNPTLRSMQYARIIQCLAEINHIPMEEATDIFYNSETFKLIDEGVADLHCRSDRYLAGEIWAEYNEDKKNG